MLSVFKFKTMQFLAITSINIKKRIKIVHCINKRLAENIDTYNKDSLFLRSPYQA